MKKLSCCNKICCICDKVVLALLCVLMADCAILGSGRAFTIGPLGLRMVWFGLLMAFSIPLIFQQLPKLLKNRILWVLAAFAAWLALQAVLGYCRGNHRALLAGDLKGFAYFVAILPALCVLNTKKRVHLLMKVIMYANALLAAAAFILLLMYNGNPKLFNRIAVWDIEHHITMFAAASSRVPRLFFKSTPYFLTTCAFPIYFAIVEKKAVRFWLYPLMVGLSLFALLLSYTRSVYLAVLVALVFVIPVFWLALKKDGRKRFAAFIGISLVACLLLVGTCTMIFRENYFAYALDRVGLTFHDEANQSSASKPSGSTTQKPSTSDPTKENKPISDKLNQNFQNSTLESDKTRAETTAELTKHIRSAPIFGHGLGKALETRNGTANEYIYLDIWMKTGIIGLLLFLAPVGILLVKLVKKIREKSENAVLIAAWMTVLLGFMAFSWFNPYMNAALGILFLCCTIGVVCACDKETN